MFFKSNHRTTSVSKFLLFIFAVATFFTACKKTEAPRAKKMSDEVFAYVYAYTSGTVSKLDPIKIRFTKPVVETSEIGKIAEKGVFRIQPEVAGAATWIQDNTLVFEPDEAFDHGQQYLVNVALSRLFEGVPAGAKDFQFNFQVRKIYYEVIVDGLVPVDVNDLSQQSIRGKVYVSEDVEKEAVERMLVAKQGKARRTIVWNHSGKDHAFRVQGVIRSNIVSKVLLEWDGTPIKVDYNGSGEVLVPALSDFSLLDAKIVQQEESYVVLTFSDPLLASQDLKGLIKFPNHYGRLRFDIDGNRVRVYPSRMMSGEQTVVANKGIKNINKIAMGEQTTLDLFFQTPKPQVRLTGSGVILPNSEGLIFPFEAIALEAVDVEVFKIHDNNILQFLQVNELDQQDELERVGTVIFQQKLALKDLSPSANPTAWTHYAIDLATLIHEDPHAIYQVRLGFQPDYAHYDCDTDEAVDGSEELTLTEEGSTLEDGEIRSIWTWDNDNYAGYRWQHRDNPCFNAYYTPGNFVRKNVLMSNLGIVAKKGKDGSVFVSVADIRNARPLSDVQLDFYNKQNQLIHSQSTDGDGIAMADMTKKAHLVVASQGDQRGYLRMTDGYSLSLSRFEVEGVERQKGMKGYIYGERGVWRPGDSLFLHFVLENQDIPDNHPVQFELIDPRGQVQQKVNTAVNVNKVYPFHTATRSDAPTGNWQAIVKIGGATFRKTLKIETVKPNRLKVDLDLGGEKLHESDGEFTGNLQVNWLHGAPARNLKAKTEMSLKSVNTTFKDFKEYVFDDPSRYFYSEPKVIFDGTLDDNGTATVNARMNTNNTAPGMMQANFKTRAFEKGGDFSTSTFNIPYYPYQRYAGVFLPKNKYDEKRLDIGKEHKVDFVLLDQDGQPVVNQNVKVGLYRVNWRWWWDRDQENLSQYNSSDHMGAQNSATITTNNKGEASWSLEVEGWGRYLVRVCDSESGHCSGDFFYAGYPWGDSEGQNRDAAAMLTVKADKEVYEVGETIKLTIPGGEEGRCLISLESGNKVIESYWKETKAGTNTFSFYATAEMTPTIYAHVALIQPHKNKKNDLPIRMYGLIPIKVEDEKTKLNPVVKMPEVLKPDENFTVEVKEKNNKAMAYTIAIVDDGLLDLTNFKTPNPWDAFFAKEALGVQTWDVYDHVLGAYGGQLERVLSVGGDAAELTPAAAKKANRFKPVVIHLGPFYLEPGKKASHELHMPNYVGSVRTMVVACGDGAYGNYEKTSPVRKPLMILATLPRTLGPTETLQLPVNVFAMEKKVKDVNISVTEKSGLVNWIGTTKQTLNFNSTGDKLANFDLSVSERVGVATFVITATGGGETATQEIEIQVRNPNPYVSETYDEVIEMGKPEELRYNPVGMKGTNKAILEVSKIPPINLGERLDYLIRYPYGCIEQTTSSGFPQLYVGRLVPLDAKQKKEVEQNLKATLEKLKTFQLTNGNFSYWPGDSYYSAWGNNYAGHFMLEAEKEGYTLPVNMKNRWVKAQKRLAKEWEPKGYTGHRYNHYGSRGWELTQAYRLYTLALAKDPEWGAMNRMLENKTLKESTRWRLAAAYAVAGKPEVANDIVKALSVTFNPYREMSGTYGSALRDEAMALETMSLLNRKDQANAAVRSIAEQLSSGEWYGTQTVAYALMAVAKHVGATDASKAFEFSYAVNGGSQQNASCTSPIMQIQVDVEGTGPQKININNKNSKQLFARLISSGQPLVGDQTSRAENLKMEVNYTNTDGEPLDPTSIEQGMDFIAEVRVTHPGLRKVTYREMALTQVFPAGWEIHNPRMDGMDGSPSTAPKYLDVRDDRVNVFFDLAKGNIFTSRIQLNAAYPGRYYLATVTCEAMYDNDVYARKAGEWVDVVGEVLE